MITQGVRQRMTQDRFIEVVAKVVNGETVEKITEDMRIAASTILKVRNSMRVACGLGKTAKLTPACILDKNMKKGFYLYQYAPAHASFEEIALGGQMVESALPPDDSNDDSSSIPIKRSSNTASRFREIIREECRHVVAEVIESMLH